jgi:BirA family biotin operon repressor/biotin-[acetyl-CoA-carboxylase] ligase
MEHLPLSADRITTALHERPSPYAGLQVHPRVASTNAIVRLDPRPWTPVVADEQTAGRGRLGRDWSTPPGTAIAVSVLVPATETPAWLPLAAGLAVLRAIVDQTGLRPVLKWPNDVLLPSDDDRKVCGILCELVPEGVIVGSGINVAQSRAELPVPTATSLRLAGAPHVDRERLLAAYLHHLADLHERVSRGDRTVREDYLAQCRTLGSDVDVHLPDGSHLVGRATTVDTQGRLVVTGVDGDHSVAAGDVVHVRPADVRGDRQE